MKNKLNNNIILLAGGSGKRLWPLSNQSHPKQFITLPNLGLSSFQLTLKRSLEICIPSNIIITINSEHERLAQQQIENLALNINDFNFILEPTPLDTAMAIYNSCKFLLNHNNDNLSYFFPTDQIILTDNNFFLDSLRRIDSTKINLFGEKSIEACSDFGYMIKEIDLKNNYFKVSKFIEKPNLTQLEELKSQELYRNLGIYLAKPSVLYNNFPKLPFSTLSIDKVISEKSTILNATKINFKWLDIGSIRNLHQCCGDIEFSNFNIDPSEITKFNSTNKAFQIECKNNKLKIYKTLSF